MNETRTINLNGLVYHIDHDAYQTLKDYLNDIEHRLPVDDRQEVMSDIESRIAELFQKALFAKKAQVITIEMVNTIKTQIGAPSEFGENRRPKVKVDKSQNTGCSRIFSIVLNVVLAILALPVILIGLFILFTLIISLFSFAVAGTTGAAVFPLVSTFINLLDEGHAYFIPLLIIALIAVVVIPIIMLVHTIVTYMRTRRGPKARFWWVTIPCWIIAVIIWIVSLVNIYHTVDNAPEILKAMTLDETLRNNDTGILTSTLQLDTFHSIQLNGAAQLHIGNADTLSTILTTNLWESLVLDSKLKVEVHDSVLYIDASNVLPIDEMMIDFCITSPHLRKITVYGASKIETIDQQSLQQPSLTLDLNGAAEADLHLNVSTLHIDAKGASSIELEGRANSATITVAGAGEVDAESFVVDDMHISCTGASQAELYVTRELWAQAAGASKITYKGNPAIKQNIAVGGSVIRRDR